MTHPGLKPVLKKGLNHIELAIVTIQKKIMVVIILIVLLTPSPLFSISLSSFCIAISSYADFASYILSP